MNILSCNDSYVHDSEFIFPSLANAHDFSTTDVKCVMPVGMTKSQRVMVCGLWGSSDILHNEPVPTISCQ